MGGACSCCSSLCLRFCINLRVSGSSDIPLHLNPRLKQGVFVRNSFLRGRWGPEERGPAPFAAGKYFEVRDRRRSTSSSSGTDAAKDTHVVLQVIIRCEQQQFKVAVDGRHLLDYRHRVQELSSITQLEVEGDVTLHDIQIL